MDLDRNKKKEPGFGRMLLSALALGLAILVGFVVGLRSGDRTRTEPLTEVSPLALPEEPVRTPDATADASSQPDSAALSDAAASLGAAASSDSAALPDTSADAVSGRYSRQQVARGVEYLASHNHWNRAEMEKIPVLQGLWDAVNTYRLDEIRRYNDVLASTPLTQIVEGLERSPKTGYYVPKGDQVITLSTYIKRMR